MTVILIIIVVYSRYFIKYYIIVYSATVKAWPHPTKMMDEKSQLTISTI